MKTKLLLTLASTVVLSACSSSSSDNASTQSITIPFSAEANNSLVDCDIQLSGVGQGVTNANVLDFRFYLHDLALTDDDGNVYSVTLEQNDWQTENVALLDFTNKESSCSGAAKDTNTEITGSVVADDDTEFTGITFTVGVPANLNHEDQIAANAPLNISSLHWNWQAGYKHMRLDVAPVGGVNAGASTSWNFHLGSTGCSGDPQIGETVTCTRPNRPDIVLTGFDPASDTVVIDYSELIENSDITVDAGGAPGCMSGATDPECAAVFTQLGMDLSTGETDNALTQTVFSVQ